LRLNEYGNEENLSVNAKKRKASRGLCGDNKHFYCEKTETLLFFPTHKPLANVGALLVDRAHSYVQEFAAVFNKKFMATDQGKLKAGGAD